MSEEHSTLRLNEDNLELWFTMVFGELRQIEASIEATQGWGFTKQHVYTKDEIFALPAFRKIYALLGQVDDLVGQWKMNHSISDDRFKVYYESRMKVEKTLAEMRARIIERKSTFLEGFVHVFNQVVQAVMNYLPMLPDLILKRIGFAPSKQQLLTRRATNISDDDV